MIYLENKDLIELEKLIKFESINIEKCFSLSINLGKLFFLNVLTDFKKVYLKKKYGYEIIPNLSTEYRYFLIGLLNNINPKYLKYLQREAIFPTDINVENLFYNISKSQY